MKRSKLNLKKSLCLSALLSLILTNCAPSQDGSDEYFSDGKSLLESKIIYGSDGRLDYYQVSDENLKKLADSTVALVNSKNIIHQDSTSVIKAATFQQNRNLCSTERFKEQETGAFCSGSLVGEDLIMTAGHCINNASDCANTRFVFGYALKQAGHLYQQVRSEDVYQCASIIKRELVGSGADYALIKLDRKVVDKKPLAIRRQGRIQVGEELVVVGHPSGLPTKITVGGKVRSVANSQYFVANTDTYGGNSGSAVFNAESGLIEGILVRGDTDYIYQNGCFVSNVCADNSCRGEDITRVSVLSDLIPEVIETPEIPSAPEAPKPAIFVAQANLTIPDRNHIGISSLLKVDQTPQGRLVVIHVDISHTWIGDLVVILQSPSGKTITLHSRAGGKQDNIRKSYFVTSALKDEKLTGEYKLTVKDLAFLDKGKLNAWAIEFR